MNFTKYRPIFLLSFVTILSTLIVWLVFYFNLGRVLGFPDTNLEAVFANYDGPNYMVISKCGYDPDCIRSSFSLPQPLEYYPAHLPGYPLIIKYFSLYTTTPKAMLLATLTGSIFLTIVTYYFFLQFFSSRRSFWLTLVSIFLPARIFVLRLVGAPEGWFIGSILLSIIFYRQKKFLPSALFAVFAQTLKSPGIILTAAYGLIFIINFFKNRKFDYRYLWYLFTPLAVIGIFYNYYIQTGDFWAYFHSGDNIHLWFLPYHVFISNHTWINTIWLEDVIYIFLIAFLGLQILYRRFRRSIIFWFPLLYVLATIFVGHRDISRYISPVAPFIILAFARYLNRPFFKTIFWIILPAIILFAINFIIGNQAPIADWAAYL